MPAEYSKSGEILVFWPYIHKFLENCHINANVICLISVLANRQVDIFYRMLKSQVKAMIYQSLSHLKVTKNKIKKKM